jgi:hypothetical protein
MPNTSTGSGKEQRGLPRTPVSLPVVLENAVGETRDLSASGVYFETDTNFGPDSVISFRIELNHLDPDRVIRLECVARVVRVEERGGKIGVAAAIESFRFEKDQESGAGPKAQPTGPAESAAGNS